MLRRLLLPVVLTLICVGANLPAQAQRKHRSGGRLLQPSSSDDVKLAPGMRLGRPLALTTDYMGRPLKPKSAKPVTVQGASSMSAKSGSTLSAPTTPAKPRTNSPAQQRKRR